MKQSAVFLFTRRELNSFHHTDLVVMVPVFARQESQVCQEVLEPRGRQALRDHQARKDPQDHVETKATQGNQEVKASRAPRDRQGQWGRKGPRAQRDHGEPKVTPAIKEAKAPLVPRGLKGPSAKRVHEEPKVTQVIQEVKALQVLKDLQEHSELTGNNAFGKILKMERTVDWSRWIMNLKVARIFIRKALTIIGL